jgi:hypothetical protein
MEMVCRIFDNAISRLHPLQTDRLQGPVEPEQQMLPLSTGGFRFDKNSNQLQTKFHTTRHILDPQAKNNELMNSSSRS